MPIEGYRGITLKRELIDKIEEYIRDYPEQGYKSLADFVTDAIRRRAEELRMFAITPRFEHVNTYEDHVLILDRKIGPQATVTLQVRTVGESSFEFHCERCGRTNCEHILYATTIPEVMRPAEKKGWKYKGKHGEI